MRLLKLKGTNVSNTEGNTLVRLNIKTSHGKRGDLVYLTDQELDDYGLYVDILEDGELEHVYSQPSLASDTPAAAVWADEDVDLDEDADDEPDDSDAN